MQFIDLKVIDNFNISKINVNFEHQFTAFFPKLLHKLPVCTLSLLILTSYTQLDIHVEKTFWCKSWHEICCNVIENVLKLRQCHLHNAKEPGTSSVICAYSVIYICHLPLHSNQTEKIETLKGQICWILLLDYSNQSGWGMSVSLKGCIFEHTLCTELSISFRIRSFVKEAQDATAESGINANAG